MTPGAPGKRRPLIWCEAYKLVTWVRRLLAKAKVTATIGDRLPRPGTSGPGSRAGPRRPASGCAARLQNPRRCRLAARPPGPGVRTRRDRAALTGRAIPTPARARHAAAGQGGAHRLAREPGRRVRKNPNQHLGGQRVAWGTLPTPRLILLMGILWPLDKYQLAV